MGSPHRRGLASRHNSEPSATWQLHGYSLARFRSIFGSARAVQVSIIFCSATVGGAEPAGYLARRCLLCERAWRESEVCDAARRPSLRKAPSVALERFADGRLFGFFCPCL